MQQEAAISKDSGTDTTSRVLGGIAIAGCVISVVMDFIGVGISDRVGMIQNTISNLAASKAEGTPADELADIGIYAFVVSVLATTAGLLRWRIDRLDWKIGSWLLVVVAVCVVLIAGYEAYTTDEGPVIHYRLVYVLGVAFPLTVLLTAGQFWEISKGLGLSLYIGGVAWAVLGPLFFFVPTGYDGAYERMLAGGMLAWFITMGVMIWDDPDIVRQVSEDQRGHD
ncbi:hypothetical protein CD351_12535 [Erythrobacter sp. KY5]|uniref:DUF998 domain-containing protein n=1 Tax=Erythrobacter sp. KY5 TaxID=2011159 RepID=UPI000DBF3106|nr:DUF998 domain-containing protein [Erythrobacter sp. KY5]AWW75256.1 hypothetical protein CD351_12535 [Erythrobacter sp. KY5]